MLIFEMHKDAAGSVLSWAENAICNGFLFMFHGNVLKEDLSSHKASLSLPGN